MQRKSIVFFVLFALIFTFVGLAHPIAVDAACTTVAAGIYNGSSGNFASGIQVSVGDVISATLTSSPPVKFSNIIAFSPTGHSKRLGDGGSSASGSFVADEAGVWSVEFGNTPTPGEIMNYSVSVGDCGGGSGVTQLTFTDGRVNSHDGQETAAVYCNENGGVNVWTVIDSKGYFAFTATKADLASVPEKPFVNTLIKSGGGVALYRLTTGELQINSTNDYVFTWRGCPAA